MFGISNEQEPCLLSGFAAGCAGGFIATVVMHATQMATATAADQLEAHQAQTREGAEKVAHEQAYGAGPQENAQEATIATKRTATTLSRGLFGHELTHDQRSVVANAIPVAFGTLVGGLYGALAEYFDVVTVCNGTAYGTAVWLGAEEIALPSLKLSKPVTQTSWSSHVTGLVGHLIYGATLESARKLIRPFLS